MLLCSYHQSCHEAVDVPGFKVLKNQTGTDANLGAFDLVPMPQESVMTC